MAAKRTTPDLSLRAADMDDLDAIHSLDCRLFPPGVCYDEETFFYHLVDPATVTFIAEAEGAFAGFAILRFETKRRACVVTIDIEPAYQRKGVGRLLMGVLEQAAGERGADAVTLQVSVDNSGAIRFYERLGYARTRLLKGYYRRREDAWEMRRELKKE